MGALAATWVWHETRHTVSREYMDCSADVPHSFDARGVGLWGLIPGCS